MAVFAGAFALHTSPSQGLAAAELLACLRRPPGSESSRWEHSGGLASLAGATVLGESTVDVDHEVAVVADARLDDPEALKRKLDAPPGASAAALIRQAYRRWGPDCVHHLDGDFAFVVWDGRTRSVFGARDRFGVRPFVYAQKAGRLWVGTQPRLMLAAGVDRQPDLWRVAEMVVGASADAEVTAFAQIRRLPAGHWMLWSDGALRTESYWRPDLSLPVQRAPLHETSEQFRDVFDASVARRMFVTPSFGAFLSGGLDSSSVVVAARSQHSDAFPVFTAIYPGLGRADEREYADDVARHTGLVPRYVEPLSGSPVAEHDADALGIDEPLFMPTWAMEKALLDAAQEHGVRALLSGHGGDHVLYGSPLGIYGDWILTGHWGRLLREARTASASWGDASRLIWTAGLKDLIRQRQPPALRTARRSPTPALLHPDLASELRFQDRLASLDPPQPTSRHRTAAFIHHPPTHMGLERMARVCEAMGISFQTPYWDRAVVELCLSVPRDHLLRGGVERVLIREAMAVRLPESVRNRTSKATFDPLLNLTLRRHARSEIEAMLDAPGELANWFYMPALRDVAARFSSAPKASLRIRTSGDAQVLLRALTLWLWRKRIGG